MMKKIMFDDRFGLTETVLAGRKTMTRRFINCPKKFKGVEELMLEFHKRPGRVFYYNCVVCDADGHELGQLLLPYEVGDVVAIAQPYKNDDVLTFNAFNKDGSKREDGAKRHKEMLKSEGYRNKMFVKAEYMPHHIRITDLWFERLQDISDEDCLKEGVFLDDTSPSCYHPFYTFPNSVEGGTPVGYETPRMAFSKLIDFVSHDHVWDCNPWDVTYTFELVD